MKARIATSRKSLPLRQLIALLCAMVLCFAPSITRQASRAGGSVADYALTDTRQGRLAVFDDVWETIDERYYDPAFGGIDWNGTRDTYRLAAADARGGQELYEILRRMIRSLNDPHTRVYSPAEKSDWWSPRFVSVGISIRQIEGVPTVVHVDPGSPAALTGIHTGDEIVSVDGTAASSLLKQRLGPGLAFKTRQSEPMRLVSMLLEGEAGTSAKVTWKNRDGKVGSAVLRRFWTQRKLGFDLSRKEGKYLVVNVQGFTQTLAIDLVRAFKEKLRDARGIVLDLRDNGGGDADAMAEIAAVFLGEGVSLGAFTDRAGATLQLISHSKSALTADRVATKLPMVVLVSERTSSAAEILAAVLQAHGRAEVMGTTSCGCVLAIRARHNLPDEGVLDVSEFDYRTSEGVRLEGRGVHPDVVLQPQRRDVYSNRDRVRDTAFEMLDKMTKNYRGS